jgi:transposase
VFDDRIAEALQLHADAHIFCSLPRACTVRAALLLAEIGDCRGRFPTEEALSAAAGVSPSTRASGRSHAVVLRHACDKRLREALIDFAADSRQASPWAKDIYDRARARGARHPHAVRILARARIRVIRRCWDRPHHLRPGPPRRTDQTHGASRGLTWGCQSSSRPSSEPPSSKNGRMRLSNMDSAEPMAMCMSRYL